ncbi:MAG: hypothetical protein J5994_01545 [Ruminococcus sp.]|nr:hypothetical protein [Ruminococcus sp.]
MPSSPVHLKLAYLMSDELGVKSKPDFLLGAISPDSVNFGTEQAGEDIRYAAHIRSRDYGVWKKQLRDFYSESKSEYADRPDLLRGYLFHCWSDIAWDEVVQPKLFEFLGTLGFGYDDMTRQKWLELYRFNSVVVGEDTYAECRRLLRSAQPAAISVCSAELIGKYRDYVADDYSDKIINETPLFLSDEHINDTAERLRSAGYLNEI